jgi:glycosyltransferase involved in cell wall biosynthesis
MSGITPVSVLVPTYNEEIHLIDCLASVAGWASEIFVVDSFSTDRTREIAGSFGATFVQHRFEGYALQKNWALENLNFKNEWVLILDADERVTPELRNEIAAILANGGTPPAGYYLNRRFIFYGNWIRHCGWYPSWNMRLFRHRLGRYEIREVDEHVVLNGPSAYCKHDLIHEDLRGIEAWIEKHNRYSTYNTRIYSKIMQGESSGEVRPRLLGNLAERKRFIKQHVWPHLPGRAFFFFLYMYFFRLGFLDGLHGFHFCVMHAVFQQFVVVKQWEVKQNVIDRACISRGSPESMSVPNRSNLEERWIQDEAQN